MHQPGCSGLSPLADGPGVSFILPAGPQKLSVQQQQQRRRRGRRTLLRPPEPRHHPARLPLPALQQQLRQPLGTVQPPAVPLPPGTARVPPARRSLNTAGLSLQTLPQGVHQPGGPEDAHPLTHPPLRVPHLRQGLLQAVAAPRTHPHTHRYESPLPPSPPPCTGV